MSSEKSSSNSSTPPTSSSHYPPDRHSPSTSANPTRPAHHVPSQNRRTHLRRHDKPSNHAGPNATTRPATTPGADLAAFHHALGSTTVPPSMTDPLRGRAPALHRSLQNCGRRNPRPPTDRAQRPRRPTPIRALPRAPPTAPAGGSVRAIASTRWMTNPGPLDTSDGSRAAISVPYTRPGCHPASTASLSRLVTRRAAALANQRAIGCGTHASISFQSTSGKSSEDCFPEADDEAWGPYLTAKRIFSVLGGLPMRTASLSVGSDRFWLGGRDSERSEESLDSSLKECAAGDRAPAGRGTVVIHRLA